MNADLLTNLIYLTVTGFITFWVGFQLYKHGRVYLSVLFPNKMEWCLMINRILLMGYYLVNLGYLAISISLWPEIQTIRMAIETLVQYTGIILLILGALHFMNLFIFYIASQRKPSNQSNLTHN